MIIIIKSNSNINLKKMYLILNVTILMLIKYLLTIILMQLKTINLIFKI